MPDTDRISLDRVIDREADAAGVGVRLTATKPEQVWTPAARQDTKWVDVILGGLRTFLDELPEAVTDSVFGITGIAFAMVAVAYFVHPNLAPVGMAATFLLTAPISVIWFMRYRREEHLQQTIDQLTDHIIELEQAVTERLDVLVRNA